MYWYHWLGAWRIQQLVCLLICCYSVTVTECTLYVVIIWCCQLLLTSHSNSNVLLITYFHNGCTAIRLPLVVEYLLQLILCCTCHCTRLITYTCADDDQSGLVSMCLCYDVHRNYVYQRCTTPVFRRCPTLGHQLRTSFYFYTCCTTYSTCNSMYCAWRMYVAL